MRPWKTLALVAIALVAALFLLPVRSGSGAGCASSGMGPTAVRSALPWEPSMAAAEAKARATGKPLVVDLGAEWCGYCKLMDRDIWPSPEIAALAGNFVWVKVDVDRSPDVAARYEVGGKPLSLPTVTVLGGDRVLGRLEGYAPGSRTADFLREALARAPSATPAAPAG